MSGRPKERYCLRGHDTHKTGRWSYGTCKECARQRRRNPAQDGEAQFVLGLRELRESWGISLVALSREARMDRGTLSNIERSKKRATREMRVRILHSLWAIRRERLEAEEAEHSKVKRLQMAGL